MRAAIGIVLASAVAAGAAGAQSPAPATSPVDYSVFAGGALPMGALADAYSTGLRVGVGVAYHVPLKPVRVRAEVAYSQLNGGTLAQMGGGGLIAVEDGSDLSFGLDAIFTDNAQRPANLYLLGGAGVHRLDAAASLSVPDDDEVVDDPDNPPAAPGAETKFGVNAGAGLAFRIGPAPAFIEAKLVKIFGADATLVPLVFGLKFGGPR